MEADSALLRQYAEAGHQAAFAEVVRRHTDLVYSTALRLVAGDAHLAQDVAQTVFTTLARKAGSLAGRENLLGWLHTTTRYAASVAVRGERRRRAREQEAATMTQNDSGTVEMDWLLLRPTLDEAVGRLRAPDREAVLLRFFQGKTHREVGAALGLNEALARKRVYRALEKLRGHLSGRGVTLSTALLGAAITTNSVQAAPAGLAANLSSSALAQAAHTGLLGSFLKGFTMTTKTKIAIAAAVVLGLAALPVVQSREISQADAQNDGLARQNNVLELAVAKLTANLKSAQSGLLLDHALAKTAAGGADFFPVQIDVIKRLSFPILSRDPFARGAIAKLSNEAVGLLGLTPEEAKQIQDVLDALQKRISGFESENLKVIEPEKMPSSPHFSDFLKGHTGKLSAYTIPAMSDEEWAAFQQWYLQSLTKVIGPDRAQIMFDKSMAQNDFPAAVLRPGAGASIAFSDGTDANGRPRTSWYEIRSSTGSGSVSNNSPLAYPDDWAPMLKDVRVGLRPPGPMLTPVQAAVQDNLREIGAAGLAYTAEMEVPQVTYQQLIEDADGEGFKPVKSVAGESYDSVVFNKGDKSVSVNVPGVGTITCDLTLYWNLDH